MILQTRYLNQMEILLLKKELTTIPHLFQTWHGNLTSSEYWRDYSAEPYHNIVINDKENGLSMLIIKYSEMFR